MNELSNILGDFSIEPTTNPQYKALPPIHLLPYIIPSLVVPLRKSLVVDRWLMPRKPKSDRPQRLLDVVVIHAKTPLKKKLADQRKWVAVG